MNYILQTERLTLRQFTGNDTAFIIELVNSEGWLKYIGDRDIKTSEQAKAYLENGPIKSYATNGFGLYLVETKAESTPIGMCGIIRRDTLDHPDIGFAFLPEYTGQGFAFEIASATMTYAAHTLKLPVILAITVPANLQSIKLLEKIGLRYSSTIDAADGATTLLLYSNEKVRDSH